MNDLPLNVARLQEYLRQAIAQMQDPRKPSNNTRYTLSEAVMGGFIAFFMQSESFLEHQRHLKSRSGMDNAQSLFGLEKIPSVEQIRNILDLIKADALFDVFAQVYRALKSSGYLNRFKLKSGQTLIALDGSEYHRSETIHCPCCSSQTHKNGTVSYFHQALFPAIVHPQQSSVVSLAPEFITPQDGHQKQDCENAAAKRWMTRHYGVFEPFQMTLLGDDLYSRQPLCVHALEHYFNFIFVCLPSSHTTLYEWLDFLEANGELYTTQARRWNGKAFELWQYRYCNRVPLRDEQPALEVNWCEVRVIRERDGEQLYLNSWVTNHTLDEHSVVEVCDAGRSRWKTENENHNILKTRGYHLEHNFGHGKQHLAKVLVTLNLLAFLFHTVLDWVDTRYQKVRAMRETRTGFFSDLLSLTKYFIFDDWQHLLDFMLSDTPQRAPQVADTS
ncbi:MAG: ISNCY family transposase [Moorea sp. SIO3C2]|nr:ISNCY family transposase [Moorena sp. SIO3C2]